MQKYAEGISREQIQVLSFEEMIEEDNPVRVFDAFENVQTHSRTKGI